MHDCVFYPQPTRKCIESACALKAALQEPGGSSAGFLGGVTNIIVRFIHPRVSVQHLLLPLQPGIVIAKLLLPAAGWPPTRLLLEYEQRVRDNERAEAEAEAGFAVLNRDQYLANVADKEEGRAQAERRLERKKRSLLRREREEQCEERSRNRKEPEQS